MKSVSTVEEKAIMLKITTAPLATLVKENQYKSL